MKVSIGILGLAVAFSAVIAPATVAAQAVPAKAKTMKTMKDMENEHASGWKELDAFHTLMAATWHPVAKSNDLKPIREKAIALSDAAQTWAASTVPAPCDKKPIRDAITAVASGSKSIAQMVAKQAPDDEVKNALKALHTRFEVVEEGCKPK